MTLVGCLVLIANLSHVVRTPGDRFERALVGVLVFQFLVSMAMGVGRNQLGLEEALAGRYAPGPLLWWAALFALQFRVTSRVGGGRFRRTVTWALPILIAALLVREQHKEARRFQNVREQREIASLALWLGEPENELCRGVYPNLELLPDRVAWLRENALSIFAHPVADLVGSQIVEPRPHPIETRPMRITERRAIPGSRFSWLEGTADAAAIPVESHLLVNDRDNRVVGLASSGWRLPRSQRLREPDGTVRWFALVPPEGARWLLLESDGGFRELATPW